METPQQINVKLVTQLAIPVLEDLQQLVNHVRKDFTCTEQLVAKLAQSISMDIIDMPNAMLVMLPAEPVLPTANINVKAVKLELSSITIDGC